MPSLPTVASRETSASHSQTFQSHVRGDNLHLRSPEAWTSATITLPICPGLCSVILPWTLDSMTHLTHIFTSLTSAP